MRRDERALILGHRMRSDAWQMAAGGGISWVRLQNYFLELPATDPRSLERKERGLAIGGELTRAGSFAGVGLGLLGSMTPSSRYVAVTVTVQLGLLR